VRKVLELNNSKPNIYLLFIYFSKDVTKPKQDNILIIYMPYNISPYPKPTNSNNKKPAFKGPYKAKDNLAK
jgi:hypothetical protein